jgi:hypothetical protein
MSNINNFIVVSDSYGYGAMAVVAYAMATNSWVFLADRSNIDQIDSILSGRTINKLLIYGDVNSEVADTLSKYNPDVINTGDRFSDNVEIVKKYSQVGSISQVLLSNGEFIEKEIMQGKNTLLFTGDENVPDVITNYIKSSNIQIGILIGNELMGAATNIRQTTGINVMVKFARSARERTSGTTDTEGLDLFYIIPLNTEPPAKVKEVENTPTPAPIVESKTNQTDMPEQTTLIQIPPGNTHTITGNAISEKETSTSNPLIIGLVIGLCLIVGLVLLGLILTRK